MVEIDVAVNEMVCRAIRLMELTKPQLVYIYSPERQYRTKKEMLKWPKALLVKRILMERHPILRERGTPICDRV